MMATRVLSEIERSDVLEGVVRLYIGDGYRLVARTSTTAQLIRPKTFSVATAVMWALLLVVGLAIYLLQYAARQDEAVYLSVDEYGQVERIQNNVRGDELKPGQWACSACGRTNRAEYFDCTGCGVRRP